MTAWVLIQRKTDGRLFIAHHNGFAGMVVSLCGGGPSWWFVPVRQWRRRWVAAMDQHWEPKSGAEFRAYRQTYPLRVIGVGKIAARPIDLGGMT